MLQHKKTLFLTILVGLIVFPSAAIGTSITETNAAIGEGCLASSPQFPRDGI